MVCLTNFSLKRKMKILKSTVKQNGALKSNQSNNNNSNNSSQPDTCK